MRVVLLNAYQIRTREELHLQLARVLELPGYYGGTLDALMDCLSQGGEETVLQVIGTRTLEERLGEGYTARLRQVLLRAAEERAGFRLCWSR